ncbi:hypothetical protein B7P43_G01567 [Cryptotermes secundus]|uniref:Uncharacterized protein n=1 Tax=Cryptotermes secundus TaxID=105785 RepID=A0A2J7PF59_9NEOP|nr:hypothetical protein B7P43_G01567 [Cryptotermes secundus]
MFMIPATGMLHLTNGSNAFIITLFRDERLQDEKLYGANNTVSAVREESCVFLMLRGVL